MVEGRQHATRIRGDQPTRSLSPGTHHSHFISRMSFAADDASPVSSLPASPAHSSSPNDADSSSATSSAGSASDLQEYRAPLNGEAPEPSIDGTSVTGGEGGIRADSVDQVSDDDKKVSKPLFPGSLGGALAACELARERHRGMAVIMWRGVSGRCDCRTR